MTGLIALAAGCHGDANRDADDAGVQHWALQRVLTIDPATDSLFDRVTTVITDADGNIFVSAEGSAGIHVYDSLGHSLRVLGRPGSGPGEFRRKYSIAWAGDTIAVYDPGNGRIEFIDRQGHWVASHTTARASGDRFYLYPADSRSFYSPQIGESTAEHAFTMLLVRDGIGVKPDTLLPHAESMAQDYAVTCSGNGIASWLSPDAPMIGNSVSPDGLLVTWRTDQYRIAFMRDSVIFRTITAGQPAIPLTDSAWSEQLADYHAWRHERSDWTCDAELPRRPASVPLLQSIEFDDKGRAWVEGMQDDSMMLAVYDTAGREVAAMPAPDRDLDVPYVIRGDRLYEVQADADGLQNVVVYAVVQ